jgi:hypothetical protein
LFFSTSIIIFRFLPLSLTRPSTPFMSAENLHRLHLHILIACSSSADELPDRHAMSTPGVSDGVVVETVDWRYMGQVRTGTKTAHGRGTCTWKKTGSKYEGEWKDDNKGGQGVYIWADGKRYEGEFKGGDMSGRGVVWIPGGRVFDGAWAGDCPLQGTAIEPDGTLFRAAFDGKSFLAVNWDKAELVPAGRITSGGPPRPGGSGGPPPAWEGRAELRDGTAVEGVFRGLRPHGRATVTERGGAAYVAEYDGERTVAEGPVPVRKQASRAAPPARGSTDG